MQVMFESRHPEAAQMRELAERRVRFALRRLSWIIPRAKVRLAEVAGAAGDKLCHLELRTWRGGIVVILSRGNDWRAALEAALARAARAMRRTWRPALLTGPRTQAA
jgi:hypothetical protein